MERAIAGYHLDPDGDWVAELTCGHDQHVRHRPPFQLRPWVVDADGRRARLGTPLECPRCDRAELPEGLPLVRTTAEWDEHTMPAGLRRAHRVASGTWGRITVREGRLRFVSGKPALDVELGPQDVQAIAPDVEHEVRPLGSVRFSIDFFAVRRLPPVRAAVVSGAGHGEDLHGQGDTAVADRGGDPACWAGLVCPECGTVVEGGDHRAGCAYGEPRASPP